MSPGADEPLAEDEVVVDATGLLCPLPILRADRAMRRVAPGATLVLLADDEGITVDLPAWCDGNGHELVSLERDSVQGPRARFRCVVRRKR